MTKLLLRLFVKNHRETANPAVRAAVGKLSGVGADIRMLVIPDEETAANVG